MLRHRRRCARSRAGVLHAVVLLLLGVFASPAFGQFAYISYNSPIPNRAPIVTPRAFRECIKALELTPEQRSEVNALYAAYRDDHAAAHAQYEDAQLEMKVEAELHKDSELLTVLWLGTGAKFAAKSERLTTGFLESMKQQLQPAQVGRWERAERIVRRHRYRAMTRGTDRRMDLTEIVVDLKIEANPPELQAALDQYEAEVDAILTKLFARFSEGLDIAIKAAENEECDTQSLEDLNNQCGGWSLDMARLNRRAAAALTPLVPEAHRKQYELEVNRTLYPGVYSMSYAERALTASLRFADLQESQRGVIDAIRQTYEHEAGPLNTKWAGILAEVHTGHWLGANNPNAEQTKRISEVKAARDALDNRTVESVKKALLAEQVKRLPRPRVLKKLDFDAPPGVEDWE
jgi:hypothetical protein